MAEIVEEVMVTDTPVPARVRRSAVQPEKE